MYDVLIIGGGPVGNYLAYLLAGEYDVAVVEMKRSFGGKACTGIIGAESYRNLRLPRRAILNELNGAKFHSKTTEFEIHRPNTQAYVVDRRELERELAVRAIKKGADYFMTTKFVGFRNGEAILRHLGEEFEISARYYVGADGVASTVAEKMGAKTEAEFMKGYELEVVGEFDRNKVEVWIDKELNENFFMWVVPVNEELARVGTFGSLENLKSFLRIRNLRPTKAVEIKAGSVALGWRKPWTKGNVALVGDAALQIKPTTAGGIVYGMICAHALESSIDSGNLSIYWNACSEVRRQISFGLKLRRAFKNMKQRDIERVFRVISDKEVIKAIEEGADFDDHLKTFKVLTKRPSVLAKLIKISPSLIKALL